MARRGSIGLYTFSEKQKLHRMMEEKAVHKQLASQHRELYNISSSFETAGTSLSGFPERFSDDHLALPVPILPQSKRARDVRKKTKRLLNRLTSSFQSSNSHASNEKSVEPQSDRNSITSRASLHSLPSALKVVHSASKFKAAVTPHIAMMNPLERMKSAQFEAERELAEEIVSQLSGLSDETVFEVIASGFSHRFLLSVIGILLIAAGMIGLICGCPSIVVGSAVCLVALMFAFQYIESTIQMTKRVRESQSFDEEDTAAAAEQEEEPHLRDSVVSVQEMNALLAYRVTKSSPRHDTTALTELEGLHMNALTADDVESIS